MTAAPRYRANVDDVRVVALDALTAVYHRPSGITHLVVAPVPEILASLTEEAASADELLARLVAAYDLADADRAALVARLDEMAAAGLIDRA